MSAIKSSVKSVFKFFSFALLGMSLALITLVWWQVIGSWYLGLVTPIGGDYYTGLTYARAFAKHLPLPTQGWLPFWNNGVPVVGGYQWLFFYPVGLLSQLMTVKQALDWASIISILLFLIASHLLYFQISKNHLISLGLTLITITSQAVYYQLTIGGMITGSSTQFYLPLALYFLFRFFEKPKSLRALATAALVLGISSIHHLGISSIFIISPAIILALCFLPGYPVSFPKKIVIFVIFLGLILLTGAIGIFPYLLKTAAEIVSPCDNPQCWGIYPYHIEKWLGFLPLVVSSLFILLAFVVRFIQRIWKGTASLKPLIPPIISLLLLVLYPLAAYFHIINTLANTIFPRRMFWTILTLLLVCAAVSFRVISRSNKLFGWIVSFIFLLLIFVFSPAKLSLTQLPQFQILTDVPNVIPSYINELILPSYKSHKELPDWINEPDPQFRLDTIKAPVIHWWNVVSDIPVTRGYTGSFNKETTQWTYFLQTALSSDDNPKINPVLYAHRMSFLIDAFGIGYNMGDDYHQLGLTENLYQANTNSFRKLNQDIASPIISGTSAPALLFVGNDIGYSTFIRAISTINLNSSRIIPVKGPENLNSITPEDYKRFPYIFLYNFKGDVGKLYPYVASGGKVFMELGSLTKIPQGISTLIPDIKFTVTEETQWHLSSDTVLIDKNKLTGFAPLKYGQTGWKMWTASESQEKLTVYLRQNNRPLLFSIPVGIGQVTVSGINLPFHLTQYLNPDEIQLFDELMKIAVGKDSFELESPVVARIVPEKLLVKTKYSTGIYFKETYHPGWTAFAQNNQFKVYPAGVNMMYIPITSTADSITIQFTGDFYSWLYACLTLLGIIIGILCVIMPHTCVKIGNVLVRPFTRLLTQQARNLHADEDKNY